MKEMIMMVVVLTVLSCVSGGLLAKLNEVTKEPIEKQILELVTAPALREMFKGASNNPVEDRFKITDGKVERTVFVADYDGKPTTVALEASGKGGYGGPVGLMVAFDLAQEKIVKVMVTTHMETPGLGANAKDDPSYTSQFADLALETPVKVTADGGKINAMSGATITSRAVCLAATEAIEIYKNIQPQIAEKLKEISK